MNGVLTEVREAIRTTVAGVTDSYEPSNMDAGN